MNKKELKINVKETVFYLIMAIAIALFGVRVILKSVENKTYHNNCNCIELINMGSSFAVD